MTESTMSHSSVFPKYIFIVILAFGTAALDLENEEEIFGNLDEDDFQELMEDQRILEANPLESQETGSYSFASATKNRSSVIPLDSLEDPDMEEMEHGNYSYLTEEDECGDFSSSGITVEGFRGKSLTRRSIDLLTGLQVPSVAVILRCQYEVDVTSSELLRFLESSGITVCVFSTLLALKTSAMEEPERSHCFRRRQWTVVLGGDALWAAQVITSAKGEGLYDARIHWIVIVIRESQSLLPTLRQFEIYQRITWLTWASRVGDWVILVSEATSEGLVVREGGQWRTKIINEDELLRGSHLQTRDREIVSLIKFRQLRPPHTGNFFGKLLRVVSIRDTYSEVVKSTTSLCYYRKDGSTRCTGYVGELLTIIVEALNLTISNRKISICGIPSDTTSRLVAISRDEADLSLGICSITYGRYQMADFSEFFVGVRSSIRSAEPKVITDAFLIFSVFTWKTWLMFPLYIVIMVLALWTITSIASGASHVPQLSVASFFVLVFKSFLYQGHERQPSSMSGRCLVAVGWLVTITLVGVFSGNLTAWLSIPRLEKPINSLEDLAKRDIDTYVPLNSENHQLFMNQTKGILGQISKRVIPDAGDAFRLTQERVTSGKAVSISSDSFHYFTATILNRIQGIRGFAPCRLHISTGQVIQTYFAFIINKNSWFKEQVDRRIRWLRSYGIVEQLKKKFNPPGCYIRNPKELLGSSRSLSLTQLQGVLWVWLAGAIASAVVFGLELYVKREPENE